MSVSDIIIDTSDIGLTLLHGLTKCIRRDF